MDKIENKNFDISDTFKNFYIVPDYQREYVWEEKHVNQLLDDIYDEFSDNKNSEYFIGSIVVCQGNLNKYEVIDGQQRLTTLFLCLCAFRKLLEKNNEDVSDIKNMLFSKTRDSSGNQISSFRLELQYENSTDIIEHISKDLDNATIQDNLTDSSRRITEAYSYIIRFLESNFGEKDGIKSFLGYFLNNVKLIQIETPKISDALKIFETINERGVGLNPMDLLKNLMFRHVQKDEFERLKIEWKKITSLLENHKERPLRFLRYFIMANYIIAKNPKGEEIIREDEIYDWITKKENINQTRYEETPFDFVKFMLSNAESYVKFLNGQDKDGNSNVYIDNVKRLSGSFRQHLMLLLAGKDLDKELFNHLAKQIEVLLFYYIITKEPTKEFERKFSRWAKEIKQISNKKDLNSFIEGRLLSEIDSKQKYFDSSFLVFDAYTLQTYRLKYILAKITQYVDQQILGYYEDRNLENYIMKGIEIEHILPWKPPTQELRDLGKDYILSVPKLGNLTLLEKPMNIVADNNFFDSKKVIYKTSRFYLTKSLAGMDTVGRNTSVTRINQLLKTFEKWDKESIEERQEMLLNLAKIIWKIRLAE